MKARLAKFGKMTVEELNKLMKAKGTPALDKTAIRQVLKEKVAGSAATGSDKQPKKAAKTSKAKEPKKPGVIATILSSITSKPITEEGILKKLVKALPEREEASLANTIKAQIGTNKRPVRMERERDIEFVVELNAKKKRTYALK